MHTTECPSTLSELLPQAITRRSNTRLNSLLPTHALALPLPPGVRAHNTLTDFDRYFMNRGVNLWNCIPNIIVHEPNISKYKQFKRKASLYLLIRFG